MKLDGIDISQLTTDSEDIVELVTRLDAILSNAPRVNCEQFIQHTVGPEAVDLTSKHFDLPISVNDTDKDPCVFVLEPRCTYIADHVLFEMAIVLSPLEFYFIDNNWPHAIYFGTRDDFQVIAENGGYPQRWYGPVGPIGSSIILECGTQLEIRRL